MLVGAAMRDEELLKLYAADQEEHKKFSQLKNENEKEKMRHTLQVNDAERRELVAEIVPHSTSIKMDVRDYFYAATIYSRGNAQIDNKEAYNYASKAYSMVRFKQDDFADKVKNLYDDIYKKLKKNDEQNKNQPNQQMKLSPLQMQPNGPMDKSKKDAEEREKEERLKKIALCCVCGQKHTGPCRPR